MRQDRQTSRSGLRRAWRLGVVLAFVLGGFGLRPAQGTPSRPVVGQFGFDGRVTPEGLVSPVREIDGGFNLVGVNVARQDPLPKIEVRRRSIKGWSPWQELDVDPDEGPDGVSSRIPSQPLWVGDAQALQLRVTGPGAQQVDGSMRVAWVRSKAEPRSVLAMGLGPTPAVAAPQRPAIISRSGWGADESIRRSAPSYASKLKIAFVHHTVGTNSYSAGESDDLVRGIYSYHVFANGWSDIGYNFLVDRYGQIFEGRAGGIERAVIGAHAGGFNTGATGVALMGTFTSASPPAAMEDALARLLAWKLDVHYVDPSGFSTMVSAGSTRYAAGTAVTLSNISSHRDVSLTACPGEVVFGRVGGYRSSAYGIGLPKMFDPSFTEALAPLSSDPGLWHRITARFSSDLSWQVSMRRSDGSVVRTDSGTSSSIDHRWSGAEGGGGPPPSDIYTILLEGSNGSGSVTPFSSQIVWVRNYPNGMLLRGSTTPHVWLLAQETLTWVASPEILESSYRWAEVAVVPETMLSRYPRAQLRFREGTLIATPNGMAWVISGGLRRRIPSGGDFEALGYSWSNIRQVDWTLANSHQVGDPLGWSGTHPDGTVIRGSGPAVYLLEGGLRRHVASEAVLASRFRWEEVVLVSDTELNRYPPGPPIGFRDGTMVGQASTGKVSLISDGARRHIINEAVFGSLGLDWNNVRWVSDPELALHLEGTPITDGKHPNGTVLRGPSGQIWILRDGRLLPIPSTQVAESHLRADEIIGISDITLSYHPAVQKGFRDGSLIVTPNGSIWQISGGLRRHIPSAEIFEGLGLSWSNLRWVGWEQAASHPEGPPIISTDSHPDGTLIRGSGPAVYFLENGARRHVFSESVLNTRFRWEEIVIVPDSELNSYPLGPPLAFRDGALVGRPATGAIWLVSDGQRRHIQTPGTFIALGLSWGNVLWVSDAELALQPEGDPVL